jgi:hypothetical protein
MKVSTIALVIYFGITLFWKLYAKVDLEKYNQETVNYWINGYWFYTSIFLCTLFYELSRQLYLNIRKFIWKIGAGYWGVMALLHLYLFFNITLYASFVSSANKITVGACFVAMILFLSTYKAFKQ